MRLAAGGVPADYRCGAARADPSRGRRPGPAARVAVGCALV